MTEPTTDIADKIKDLRQRILAGEEVSREELREALLFQREVRFDLHAAIKKPAAKKTKAKPVSLDSLL